MKNRWLFGFLMILMLSVGYVVPQQVSASSALHVEAEIGVENRVKREMPTFIDLTITNNGDPFSGDLVVDAETRYDIGSALVFPVDIATGETKTMKIYLDGFSDRYSYTTPLPDFFHFYEGGIEKGKKVKYEGDHSVNPRIFEPYTAMGLVVTTKKDEVSALDRMDTYANDEVEVFYINNKNHAYLAEDARALAMLNLIVFDDIAVHDLSEKQQQALLSWVQQGGTIAFAPNNVGPSAAGIFEEYLPLTLTAEKTIVPVEAFKSYVAANAQIPPVMVYNAALNAGSKEALSLDGKLLAGSKQVGKGQVLQLTFPLNDPVISKLSGYGRLMVDAFDVNGMQQAGADIFKYGYAPDWLYTNELFDTFRVNIWLIVGGIAVYIVFIGPVLYMLLKRKDKREKMWVLVPIIAIVTSLLFFVFGARDRLFKPQIEQMALYEVQEDGALIGTFTNALLSNRAGDFTFNLEEGTTAAASTNNDLGSTTLHLQSFIKETSEGTQLTLRDMDYWSVESLVGETVLQDVGRFETDLTLADGKLTGTITNNLPVDLKGLMVLAGRDEIVIGAIKAGETVNVNEEVEKKFLAQPYDAGAYSYSNTNAPLSIEETKLDLFKSAAIYANGTHKGPLLVGWSDVSLTPVVYDGNAKQQTMSYFVQAIQPKVIISGEVMFNEDDIMPSIMSDNNSYGHIEENDISKAYLSEGIHEVYYDFVSSDEMKDMNWKELVIEYDDSLLEVELYNHQTKETIELKEGRATVLENVAAFIEQDDYLQLSFKVSRIGMDNGEPVQLPTFELKGEPKQ